jgi:thiamine-phosphate pyrophosphorylase
MQPGNVETVGTVGRLHVLTDTHLQQRYSHYQLLELAIAVGVPVVQYREKQFVAATHQQELVQMLAQRNGTTTALLINDYLELAATLGADGVHLGASDQPVETAIKRLPPELCWYRPGIWYCL